VAPYESISDLDRTHRLVMSWIWELPFGRGRRFGSNLPKPIEFLAGGWQLDSVVQRQSGPPLGFGDVWTLFTGHQEGPSGAGGVAPIAHEQARSISA